MSEEEIVEPSEGELTDTEPELDDELPTDTVNGAELLGFRVSTLDE